DVGLAAVAQAEALALDSAHIGARAQRAAALEALGDDDGAARELGELLSRIGPQPALSARLAGVEQSAKRAASRRLLGGSLARLLRSISSVRVGCLLSSSPPKPASARTGSPVHMWSGPSRAATAHGATRSSPGSDASTPARTACAGRRACSRGSALPRRSGSRASSPAAWRAGRCSAAPS